MEQFTASIAHELNQPLAAVVASGNACLNWLSAAPPNLGNGATLPNGLCVTGIGQEMF
jgi:hypothetical protein